MEWFFVLVLVVILFGAIRLGGHQGPAVMGRGRSQVWAASCGRCAPERW
jgi:hypothetical protein